MILLMVYRVRQLKYYVSNVVHFFNHDTLNNIKKSSGRKHVEMVLL